MPPATPPPARTPDPDQLVQLTTARTEFEGSSFRSVLEAEGIPVKVFATAANALQWQVGFTDPIKIMVRRADLQRAADLLRRNRQDSIDIDWAEVDVGSMEEGAPPVMPRLAEDRWKWRRRIRYAGFVLIGASVIIGRFAPDMALPVVGASILLIAAAWNDDFGRTPPHRG